MIQVLGVVRKALYILLSFFVLVAFALVLGSIDSSGYDELGLTDQIRDVTDSQNGYTSVAYTQTENFQLFEDSEDSGVLREHVYLESWDEALVAQRLAVSERHMNSAISSLDYPFFKFPPSDGFSSMPRYGPLIDIARLLLIKSISEAKGNNFEQAIQFSGYAVAFSQKIKTESNYWLISHMIGLVMQYEALVWLHHLAAEYDLDRRQYNQLLVILSNIPAYHQDSFSQVFAGEFVFAKAMTTMIADRPFQERWSEYWDGEDWWNAEFGVDEREVKDELFYFMLMLFPDFYVHKNLMLGNTAKEYRMMSEEAQKFCSDIGLVEETSTNIEWLDIVTPNALARQWAGNTATFRQYYTRRCFGQAHIEATKAAVALISYNNDHGRVPEHLAEVVPLYLSSIPVDPFDGKALRYQADKTYVYSVGTNFSDDGGSETYFVRRCEQENACSENPTFSVLSALPAMDDYPCSENE